MSDRLSFAATVTADGRRLKGSIQLAGARTFRNGEWVEVDVPALMKADRAKAFASMEHDDRHILGASSNQTLDVRFSDQGFEWETAELPNTSYANDALELVGRGYVSGSSFEIDGLRSSFSTDPDGTRIRRYTGIKRLLSVSPVRDPAFPRQRNPKLALLSESWSAQFPSGKLR
jgi:phage head maturation protease